MTTLWSWYCFWDFSFVGVIFELWQMPAWNEGQIRENDLHWEEFISHSGICLSSATKETPNSPCPPSRKKKKRKHQLSVNSFQVLLVGFLCDSSQKSLSLSYSWNFCSKSRNNNVRNYAHRRTRTRVMYACAHPSMYKTHSPSLITASIIRYIHTLSGTYRNAYTNETQAPHKSILKMNQK